MLGINHLSLCRLHKFLCGVCYYSSQVISGGNYDVDCFVTDPQGSVLYNEKKKQHDNFSHTTTMKGIYKVCFGNEFSSYTHKTVYLEFRHGEEQPLLESMSRVTALTQVCERIIELNVSVCFRCSTFYAVAQQRIQFHLMRMLNIRQCVKY